jgi:hypothetical protein
MLYIVKYLVADITLYWILFHTQYNTEEGVEHILYTTFLLENLLGGCGLDVDMELVCIGAEIEESD